MLLIIIPVNINKAIMCTTMYKPPVMIKILMNMENNSDMVRIILSKFLCLRALKGFFWLFLDFYVF